MTHERKENQPQTRLQTVYGDSYLKLRSEYPNAWGIMPVGDGQWRGVNEQHSEIEPDNIQRKTK